MRWFALVFVISCTNQEPDLVYLDEHIAGIRQDVRYHSNDNFMGTRADGYLVPRAMLTRTAADALLKVQEDLAKSNLGLKVFDGYRPQKAVDHFSRWALDLNDTTSKRKYYPNVPKSKLFDLGYIASRSGHTRGSTVDLTIINLTTGNELDMGSPWDFFGEISHHGSPLITEEQSRNRDILLQVMTKHGFRRYDKEWWHYTLENEPFPDTYFNLDIK